MAKSRRTNDRITTTDSAPAKAHGTHGKGDDREQLDSRPPTLPGSNTREQDDESPAERVDPRHAHLSDAGWGSSGSGGSVVDKRARDEEK
ncbi:MAG TPA: hypothetical protein VF166_15220 [Gemmatimonadaceae bacterium]